MIKRLKKSWILLAFLLIAIAIVLSIFRSITPWATQYKSEIEQHLSALVGEPVTIKTVETGWYWFEPVIKLNQVTVTSHQNTVIRLNKLLVGIDLLSSFWHRRFQPGVLYLDGLDLTLNQKENNWQIEGLPSFEHSNQMEDGLNYKLALAWVFAQQKIIINHVSIQVNLQDKTTIPLSNLYLVIANHFGHYRVKGSASLAQAVATQFKWAASLMLDPDSLNHTSGHAYLSIQRGLFKQWQRFIPSTRFQITEGEGDVQLWFDFANGAIKHTQATLDAQQLTWQDSSTNQTQFIPVASANLAWHATRTGWELAGDRVRFVLPEEQWPINRFLVRYTQATSDYLVFIKTILVHSLLTHIPKEINSPLLTLNLSTLKPHGTLNDTQIHIQNKNVNEVLTRFSDLGWNVQDARPGVEHLSGVFHWQPQSGRLALGSEKTEIRLKHQSPVTFSMLNMDLQWAQKEKGFQFNLKRLVLVHPDVLLNAHGNMDDVSKDSAGQLNLTAQFALTNAQQWLPYLPSASLKPKLNRWLKRDIKRIDKMKGEVHIKGLASDFPFDKAPGQFLIKSHLQGMDLIFAHGWPLTRNIEAFLTIDKRTLDANIVHADLKGVGLDKANVRVTHLGLNQETLLVRGKVDTRSDKAKSYVLSSPLRKKWSALSLLQLKGQLGLNLQLDIALYPGNDDVWILGDLNFINNTLTLHHSLGDFEINQLNGSLQFDQEGVLESHLNATIKDRPVAISIQSILQPKPYTEVKLVGSTNIEQLRKLLSSPILSLMDGPLNLEASLILMNDPQLLNHLRIHSSLKDLNVDLPPPLGKKSGTATPLNIDTKFNNKQVVGLNFNYGNRLRGALEFTDAKGVLAVQKGVIQIGKEQSSGQDKEGLTLLGTFSSFDLAPWLMIKEKLSSYKTKSDLFDKVDSIDFKFRTATIKDKSFQDLAIAAEKAEKGEWLIHLNQADFSANLRYQYSTNTLTGAFDHLSMHSSHNESNTPKPVLNIADMPNLDVHITSFDWDEMNLGKVALKATRLPHLWRIDSCKITAPSYQFYAQGEWKQDNTVNATTLQAQLKIDDLAQSLTRWKISPAVAARQGDLQFEGSWPGSIKDFTFANVAGKISVRFKEGVIRHLSQEVQDKLAFGKLLSILSLQTIPRRLKLDFSDLSEGGYSFDEFKGNFAVSHGAMETDDSYIDGPVAHASMSGRLDIVKRYYDIDLHVSPYITSSLPVVAATIAGGPLAASVAGVATWVANKVINQSVQKITGYTYRITGPWSDPKVRPVSIIEKRR